MEVSLAKLAILFGFANAIAIVYAVIRHGLGLNFNSILLFVALVNFVLIVYGFSRTKQLLRQHETGMDALNLQIAEGTKNASLEVLLKMEQDNRKGKRK